MNPKNQNSPKPRLPWLALLAVAIPVVMSAALLTLKRDFGPRDVFIGFTHVDDVVYFACAREYHENGNGLFAATPYSSLPDSPRVYSHLVYLVIGWLHRITQAEITQINYALRIVFGGGMLLLALAVTRRAIPRDGPLTAACLAAMLCSGSAWLFATGRMIIDFVVTSFSTGSIPDPMNWALTWPEFFRQAESGYGTWGLNLFRPAGMTMEAAYHILFFSCIHSVLRARHRLALLFLFLTWWAHPFTGIGLGLILTAFHFHELMIRRDLPASLLAGSVGINLLFFAYYGLFLPSIPEHRSVHERMMAQGTPMLFGKLLPAYGLFLICALAYARTLAFRRRWHTDAATRLLVIWALCSASLIFHDRLLPFIHPVQPMHFTRGYLFFPLLLLSFGYLRRLGLTRWRARPRLRVLAILAIFVIHTPDNLIYTALELRDLAPGRSEFRITRDCRELLRRIDNLPETLTLAAFDLPPLYAGFTPLVPVLTHHRILIGHRFNTPFHDMKMELQGLLATDPSAGLFAESRVTAVVCGPDYYDKLRQRLEPREYRLLLTRRDIRVVGIGVAPGETENRGSR